MRIAVLGPVQGALGRVRRVASAAARWWGTRVGFVAVAVGLAVWALWSRWPEVVSAVQRLDARDLVLAALATLINAVLTGLAWRALLADLGARLPVGLAARVFFVGQIGKYVPGSLWPMIVQAELAKRHVARRSTVAATFVLLLLSGASALLVVLVALPLTPNGGGEAVRWAALLVVPVVAVLHPGLLGRLLDRGLRLVGRQPLEQWTSVRGTAVATGWALLAWIAAGLQVWLLAVPLGAPATWRTLALTTGGYALAWAIGLVVVVAPAGAGAREVALAAVLSTVLDRGAVVVVVLLSRVLFTAADLTLAGIGFTVGRSSADGLTPPVARGSRSTDRPSRTS
jgi:glycosyltransferase 2 family protein